MAAGAGGPSAGTCRVAWQGPSGVGRSTSIRGTASSYQRSRQCSDTGCGRRRHDAPPRTPAGSPAPHLEASITTVRAWRCGPTSRPRSPSTTPTACCPAATPCTSSACSGSRRPRPRPCSRRAAATAPPAAAPPAARRAAAAASAARPRPTRRTTTSPRHAPAPQDVTFPGGTGTMSGAYAAADNPQRRRAGRPREPRPDRPHPRGGRPARRRRLQRAGPGPALPRGRHRRRPRRHRRARRHQHRRPRHRPAQRPDELGRRASGPRWASIGFCFGGGMVWQLLDSGPSELQPRSRSTARRRTRRRFTGRRPPCWASSPRRTPGSTRAATSWTAALTAAGLTHEMVTVPGVDHAFFNDTGRALQRGGGGAGLPAGARLVRRPPDLIGRKRFHPLGGDRWPAERIDV